MATGINSEVAQELQPAIRALQPHGFVLMTTEGSGMMLTADFRRDKAFIQIVKDRGSWFINGDSEELKISPARKSQSAVIRDALDWISKHDA